VSDARYPFELAMSIEQIEGGLREAAVAHGVKIEQPWTPVSLVVNSASANGVDNYPVEARGLADDYPIEARDFLLDPEPWLTLAQVTIGRSPGILHNGGPSLDRRTIRAKYVVGCDGASSF
jgi:hypothetical protein